MQAYLQMKRRKLTWIELSTHALAQDENVSQGNISLHSFVNWQW